MPRTGERRRLRIGGGARLTMVVPSRSRPPRSCLSFGSVTAISIGITNLVQIEHFGDRPDGDFAVYGPFAPDPYL